MTVQDADPPELQAIAERARRRQRRMGMAVIICGIAVAALGGLMASVFRPRNHHAHHSGSTLLGVIVLAAGIVILITEGVLIYWLVGRKGFFKPPLTFGLPYRDRRTVLKAVRRGQPPQDATLRAVGVKMAERTVRQRTQVIVLYLVFAFAQAVNAAVPDRPAWIRIVEAGSAVLFLLAPFYQRTLVRGARRYLQQVADPGGNYGPEPLT